MNVALQAFEFLRPWWLLALLALPPWAWWMRRRQAQRDAWREAIDPHLLPHLVQGRLLRTSFWRIALPLTAATLAIVALAGPSVRHVPQPLWQDRRPLVIVADLSKASLDAGGSLSLLQLEKAKIGRLLQQQTGGQIALVAYADDAYTVSPLTDDAANIALFVDALAPDVMPEDGNRPDRGIDEARRLLKRAGFAQGDILLFGHDDAVSLRGAARRARGDGFRVSALGFGRDADSLRGAADAGEGRFAIAGVRDDDLDSLGLHTGATLGADAVDLRHRTARRAIDDGYWLLLPLMGLMLFAFRRGAQVAVLLLACLPWAFAHARDAAAPATPVATQGTLWRRADQVQAARMRQGYEAYRQGQFAQAEEAWRGLPGADAAYNRGNALAKQGQYDAALAEYAQALRERPDMADARVNRDRVQAALRRQPPPSQQDRKQQDQQQGQQQRGQQQQGQQQQGQQQQGQQQGQTLQRATPASRARDGRDLAAQATAATAEDRRTQARADAELRKRLDAAKPGRASATPQARTQADVEAAGRRVVDESWLRRVPDDPGALLRAKFALEARRRLRDGGRE